MTYQPPPDPARVAAFRGALLNTCVRGVRAAFEAGLSLANCLDSEDFRGLAYGLLQTPLLCRAVEPAMEAARRGLLRELEGRR